MSVKPIKEYPHVSEKQVRDLVDHIMYENDDVNVIGTATLKNGFEVSVTLPLTGDYQKDKKEVDKLIYERVLELQTYFLYSIREDEDLVMVELISTNGDKKIIKGRQVQRLIDFAVNTVLYQFEDEDREDPQTKIKVDMAMKALWDAIFEVMPVQNQNQDLLE